MLPRGYNMHAYCLFCETQRCDDIAAILQKTTGHRCISPQIVQRKWVKGKPFEVKHRWLPGYIFVYTEEAVLPFFKADGIIRCLGNDELSGNDKMLADMIFQRDGLIGIVKLVEVGERCKVDDPAWEGLSGTVIKMDRSRKRCCIAFEFDGETRNVWLGYEMVIPLRDE